MEFKNLIKNYRKENNLSQKELCEIIGISLSCLQNWEAGKNPPSIKNEEVLKKISKLFKIEYEEIINAVAESAKNNADKEEVYLFLPDEYRKINLNKTLTDILMLIYSFRDEKYVNFSPMFIQTICLKYNATVYNYAIKELKELEIIINEQRKEWDGNYKNTGKIIFSNKGLKIINLIIDNLLDDFKVQSLNKKNIIYFYDKFNKNILLDAYRKEKILKPNKFDLNENKHLYIFKKEERNDNEYLEKKDLNRIELSKYEQNYENWKKKMEKIKEKQELYGKEEYPDISEPIKPSFEKEYVEFIQLNDAGKQLAEIISEVENIEI